MHLDGLALAQGIILSALDAMRPEARQPDWHGKLALLYCEYTGGHLGGSEFNDMVCELVAENLSAMLSQPQSNEL